ncbi:hypothetical protein FO519_000133 [Halicephalobus sp. NKZ332]|nr:hypothetical protein FO519_000133 [Halicephalobus sp. NKZ332]
MTESEEERKAAASRIIHNLKDGVEALTEVLENYENTNNSTASPENINNPIVFPDNVNSPILSSENVNNPTVSSDNNNISERPLKREISDFVVTESQIISISEDITQKGTQECTSKDTLTLKESTSDDSVFIEESVCSDAVTMEESNSGDTIFMKESASGDTVTIEKSTSSTDDNIEVVWRSITKEKSEESDEETSVKGQSLLFSDQSNSEKVAKTEELRVVIPERDYFEGEVGHCGDKADYSEDKICSEDKADYSKDQVHYPEDEIHYFKDRIDFSDDEFGSTGPEIETHQNSGNMNGAFNNRRAIAQVPPQTLQKVQKPRPAERRRLRVEDCVPAEYTSSPIVQILAAADQERPLPPRSLHEINKSLEAMSSSSVFPHSKLVNSLTVNSPMTTSLFTGISPGSSSGSSGVSSSSDFNRPGKIHEIKVQKEKRSSTSNLPRMGISSIPVSSNLGLLEVIIRTHPIWYLPHLGRATVNHMLRPMPPGAFIVRASTRPSSMALSIKLPSKYSTETDHYLIEKHGSTVRLEGSPHIFKSLPMLIEYYCKCHEELQCRLTLPPAIQMCTGIMDIQRVSLMGQDFWTSELARVPPYKRQVSQPVFSTSEFSEEKRKNMKTISPVYSSSLSNQLQVDFLGKKPEVKPRKQLQTKNSMLKKSQSENEGLQNQGELNSASSSVSSKSSKNPKQYFLKNFFSSNSNSTEPSTSNSPNFSTFYNDRGISDSTKNFTLYGYIPPKEASNSSSSPSTTSSLRKSFARLTSFKSKPKSKDDTSFNKMSAEAVKARQAAFRREKTDISGISGLSGISGISVERLAGHRDMDRSPTNRMFVKKESEVKNPLVPPKEKMDEDAMHKCIDELRNKRLNSSMKKTEPKTTPGEIQKDTASILKEFGGFLQNNGKPYEVILRNKKTSPQIRKNPQDRLSVPNLNEDQNEEFSEIKFGRAPETGELGTINEGLITPVVRRKNYGQKLNNNPLVNGTKDNYTNAEYFENSLQKKNEEKRSKQGPSVPQKPAGLSSSNSFSKVGTSSRSLYSVVTPGKQNNNFLNWSEVNSELKLKQRIAKVRPTPQHIASSKMSSPGIEPPAKRQSDYAQLAEFGSSHDPDASIGSFHSMNSNPGQCDEDDAVSVAGTVFNEPWDSSAWENLLEIAKYGDERPNVRAAANSFYLNSSSTIEEESSSPPLDVDDVVISCVESDSDEPLPSPESDDVQVIQEHVGNQMEESIDSLSSLKNSGSNKNLLSIGNRVWTEMSQRIPSEPGSKAGTFDPRRMKSNSMMNVAMNSLNRRRMMSPQQRSINTSPTRLRSASARPPTADPGTRIQNYVETIAKDTNTVFGATLRRFIECTIEAEECDPHVVVRNVRQFLNGIKNYLVKHGEGDLHAMIEVESGNLAPNEFLNIDAILEAVLHKILLVPVKNHLYHLMVKEHSRNGSLQSLSENLLKVRTMKPEELGFSPAMQMPDLKDLEIIKNYLRKMQEHYSPLKKLENLLKALAVVICLNDNVIENNNSPKKNLVGVLGSKKLPPADELIKWLVFILAKTSTINCEVEAWYMWELLPQQLLTTGDAAYYLTTLFSAVHVLKNPESIQRLKRGGMPLDCDFRRLENAADAFVSVAIPDEQAGSIEYHTFPAVPQMNAAKLCRVIAHQFAITNPEDYGLYILFDGFETCLLANECPDAIRDQLLQAGKPHLFAYKRHEAKIAWPKNVISSSSQSSSNPSPKSSPEIQVAFQLRPAHTVQPSPIHKRRQFPVASKIV